MVSGKSAMWGLAVSIPTGGQGVGPAFAPAKWGVDEVLYGHAGQEVVERPAGGGVADDEHTIAIPASGEIGEKGCYAINYLAVAFAVGVGGVDVERTGRL